MYKITVLIFVLRRAVCVRCRPELHGVNKQDGHLTCHPDPQYCQLTVLPIKIVMVISAYLDKICVPHSSVEQTPCNEEPTVGIR